MLVKWNPVVPSLFNAFEKSVLQDWLNGSEPAVEYVPHVDVIESEEAYLVRAELPGMKKDAVKITLENQVLTLSGERRHAENKPESNYLLRETLQGRFERRFRLSQNIDRQGIRAEYKDGILEITLPKTKEAQRKEIEIRMS